jgi:hypothetical protein
VTWLSPLWLAALAALAVPILIHLRRRRVGRRIQVGSVRHLAGAARPRRRQLRIRDPWLLGLRCAIVALMVLGLVEPAMRPKREPARDWVLVAPSLLHDSTLLRSDQLLDSLRRAGTAVRQLAPGFPAADLGRPIAGADPHTDLWSLLRAADEVLPAGSRIVVVVPAELSLARGRRPALATRVTIRPAPRPVGDTTVIRRSWIRHDSAFRVVGSLYRGGMRQRIERAPRAESDSGLPTLDSTTIRIAAPGSRAEDAAYLRAAFGAASDLFGAAMPVEVLPPSGVKPGVVRTGDWTAWLDTTPPPPLQGAVLTDAGPAQPRASDGATAEPPTDAFGRPLLRRSGSRAYAFTSRFNPRFGDLVLRPAFPEMIARIWLAGMAGVGPSPAHELRSISPAQLEPAHGTRRAAPGDQRSLRDLLLALAAILLFVERWLAHRRPA